MHKNRRPRLIVNASLLVAACLGASLGACQAPPVADWPRATPEEAGFGADMGEAIDAGVRDGRFENLHGVVIARGGKIVLERYYDGEDETMGRPLGAVAFGPNELHDLRSVTKSIVSLLYGIALGEGTVPPLDAPLIDQFPEYPDLAADPPRRRITVAHALSMQVGLEWDERISYLDPRNSEHAMELADDRYRFVLERPIMTAPGGQWVYNGGTTAVLGRLIEKGSGLTLRDYAEAKLFAPLGITAFEWVRGYDGADIAASGLRLRPRDLARIGQMVLNGGRWEGRQIVSEDWLAQSFETRVNVDVDIDYGYQWWLSPEHAEGPPMIAGMGNGGQRLFIVPEADLVVAVTAGNYNRRPAARKSTVLVRELILPALKPDPR